jgi:hypothetical protein
MAINKSTLESSIQAKLDATTSSTDSKEILLLTKSLEALDAAVGGGVEAVADEANLPTASADNEGLMYYATEENTLWLSDGSTLLPVKTGGPTINSVVSWDVLPTASSTNEGNLYYVEDSSEIRVSNGSSFDTLAKDATQYYPNVGDVAYTSIWTASSSSVSAIKLVVSAHASSGSTSACHSMEVLASKSSGDGDFVTYAEIYDWEYNKLFNLDTTISGGLLTVRARGIGQDVDITVHGIEV